MTSPLAPSILFAGPLLCLAVLQTLPGAAAVEERIFTVPSGAAGFYRLTTAAVKVAPASAGPVELRVTVRRGIPPADGQPPALLRTTLAPGTHYEFDPFLGYLDEGDKVVCRLSSVVGAPAPLPDLRWQVERTPAIPAAAIVTRDGEPAASLEMTVPHSGFHALDGATVELVESAAGPVRVTVSCGIRTLREATLAGGKALLNGELGYLRRGETLRLAVVAPGGVPAAATFRGTLVEWAPRRAPLRVRRGPDGLLDVLEPGAPLTPVDVPAERWLRVAATAGDATAAIRKALGDAGALAAAAATRA